MSGPNTVSQTTKQYFEESAPFMTRQSVFSGKRPTTARVATWIGPLVRVSAKFDLSIMISGSRESSQYRPLMPCQITLLVERATAVFPVTCMWLDLHVCALKDDSALDFD